MFQGRKLHADWLKNSDVLHIRLDNPNLLNALDQQMAAEARQLKTLLPASGARVLLFSGVGRVFSAGGDLNYLDALTYKKEEEIIAEMRPFYSAFLDLARYPLPTIAHINGHAVGAGFCFALACDMHVVNEEAKLGVNFVKLGLAPGMAAEYIFKKLPRPLATELLAAGEITRARQLADRFSFFNFTGPAAEAQKRAEQLALAVASNSRKAVGYALKSLREEVSLHEVLDRQAAAQADCMVNGEVRDAIVAVKNKKPFKFTD